VCAVTAYFGWFLRDCTWYSWLLVDAHHDELMTVLLFAVLVLKALQVMCRMLY